MKAAELNINHRYDIGFVFTVQLIGYFVQIFSPARAMFYKTMSMLRTFLRWIAGIAVSVQHGLRALRPGFVCGQCDIFLFSTKSRPALFPTHPPFQWVPVALSSGQDGSSVKLTTRFFLVSKSRKMELYLHSYTCLHGLLVILD